MKITVNGVEVVKHQSNWPIVVVFVYGGRACSVFSVICTRRPAHHKTMQAKT